MSNASSVKFLNILIIIILTIQVFLIFFNTKISVTNIEHKKISIENFSSIVLSKYGITSFGSENLLKKDDSNIYLKGVSYLENESFKIYGYDIQINTQTEISFSDQPVKMINSMGKMSSQGFNNIATEKKIYFLGNSIFRFND